MVTPVVYTTPTFSNLVNKDFRKRCRPCFSLKTPGLRFSIKGAKRRLLKTMAWLPTFALRILNDRVNNNIGTELQSLLALLSFLAAIVQLNSAFF